MRSVELPKTIAKGISAEARRRSLSMTVSLSGSPMEVEQQLHTCGPGPNNMSPCPHNKPLSS